MHSPYHNARGIHLHHFLNLFLLLDPRAGRGVQCGRQPGEEVPAGQDGGGEAGVPGGERGVRPGRQQQLSNLGEAEHGCQVERGPAVAPALLVDQGPGGQEVGQDGDGLAVGNGVEQRSLPDTVRLVDRSAQLGRILLNSRSVL